MKKCPYCAEEIQDAAIVCRYCGRELTKPIVPQQQPAVSKPAAPVTPTTPTSKLKALLFVAAAGLGSLCVMAMISSAISAVIPKTPPTEAAPTQTAKTSNIVISTYTSVPSMTPPSYTATPRPSPTSNIGAINELKEAGGIALTVLDVTKRDRLDFLTADPGNTFLVLDVSIENSGRPDGAPYNPLYFSLKDSSNYEYNVTLFAPDPSLKSGELAIGEKVRGFVAFQVNSASMGFVVTYKPLVILGGYESIRISLDRYGNSQLSQGTPGRGPCEGCNFECPKKQGEFEFCIVDPELVVDKNLLQRTVNEYCNVKGGNFCKFLIWTDSSYLPESLPMSDLQLNNQAADYTRNTVTGNDCLKLLSGGNVIYSSDGCQ